MPTADRDEFPSLSRPRPESHAWIQWKGTEVCCDVRCRCGAQFHFDGGPMYHVRCGTCGQVYECSGVVELIPLDFEPDGTRRLGDDGDGPEDG